MECCSRPAVSTVLPGAWWWTRAVEWSGKRGCSVAFGHWSCWHARATQLCLWWDVFVAPICVIHSLPPDTRQASSFNRPALPLLWSFPLSLICSHSNIHCGLPLFLLGVERIMICPLKHQLPSSNGSTHKSLLAARTQVHFFIFSLYMASSNVPRVCDH